MTKFNPGDVAPVTGCYKVVDESGRKMNTVDVHKGDRLPPTESSSYHYEFND